jgi:hypothetical protein
MVERPQLRVVMLVIAAATLGIDITRFVLEQAGPRTIQEPVPMQPRLIQQEVSVQAPEPRQPDITQQDTPQKKAKSLDATDARGPPRRPRELGRFRAPFSPLPPDFSINCPPWRAARRQPMHQNFDRRRFYDW